jgi:hypothetical protein
MKLPHNLQVFFSSMFIVDSSIFEVAKNFSFFQTYYEFFMFLKFVVA